MTRKQSRSLPSKGGLVTFKVPAFDSTDCPKCGAGNAGRKVYVWKVADERGIHFECDVCSKAWPFTSETPNVPR